MVPQSLFSRLALGGAVATASNVSGAIVVFDTQDQALSAAGQQLFIGGITLTGGFTIGTNNPALITLLAYSDYNFFEIAGAPISPTSRGDRDLLLLDFGDTVSAASYFESSAIESLSNISLGVHYVGLRWSSGEQSYYGWLQLTRSSQSELQINQFAFNDVAGQSILAGQTTAVPEASTLGLVGGLFGLIAAAHVRRRKQKQAAASDTFLALAAGERLN